MIVDAKPTFEVYFDATQGGITAVVKANYGSIGLRLPNDVNGNGKIVVRDYEIENDLLSSFKMFNLQDGTFMLKSDREIYLFLSDEIPVLKEKAKLYYSDRFAGLKIMDRVDISASVIYNSGVDLLEADFESNLSYEQISGILSAVKLKKRFYRLSNGSFIDLENSKQKDIFNLLDQLDFSFEDIKNGKKVIPKYHALYLNSLSSVEKNEEFKKYIEEIKNIEPVIPSEVSDILRGYQKDGMAWLSQLSYLGFGGILADDMGLGKTLQVIAIYSRNKTRKTDAYRCTECTYL